MDSISLKSQKRTFISREREHWQRNWNWDINSNLSRLSSIGEIPCKEPTFREDGGSISPGILVDDLKGLFIGFNSHNCQSWAKQLLTVSWDFPSTSRGHVNNCWTEEISIWILRMGVVSAIQ